MVPAFVSKGLDNPVGLAFDAPDNLYVANNTNNTISTVTLAGAVSTFVSSPASTTTPYGQTFGLAFDAAGDLFIASGGNNTIFKLTPTGTVSTFVSSGLGTPPAWPSGPASFTSPTTAKTRSPR